MDEIFVAEPKIYPVIFMFLRFGYTCEAEDSDWANA